MDGGYKSQSRPIDRALEELVLFLGDTNIQVIEPKFSLQLGFYYEDIMKIASKYRIPEVRLLEELVERGYATRELYSKFVRCPNCKSYRLLMQFVCPRCGAINVSKVTLVSHVPCGYIGVLEELEKGGRYVCPKCGKELKREGADYTRIGGLYRCNECGELFDMPGVKVKCMGCGHEFLQLDADYHPIYRYKINLDRIREVTRDTIVRAVAASLSREGYSILINPELRGTSGLLHRSSLLVKSRNGDSVIVDVVERGSTGSTDVMMIYGKIIDLGNPKHIIVVSEELVKNMSSDGSTLNLLGYRSASEAVRKTVETVKNILSSGH